MRAARRIVSGPISPFLWLLPAIQGTLMPMVVHNRAAQQLESQNNWAFAGKMD